MLIEHLPPFMRDFEEFKKLFDIEDSVLDELKDTYKRHEDNLWIQTADEYGIKRREKLIGIEKPEGDLEDRRKVVLSEWSSILPFNYETLNQWLLRYLDKDNYTIEIDFPNYKVTLMLSLFVMAKREYIKKSLRKKLPANMIIEVDIDYNRYLDFRSFTHSDIKNRKIKIKNMKDTIL